MTSSVCVLPSRIDPLEYLPRTSVIEYRRRSEIYSPDNPPASIYLVIDGSVKVSLVSLHGRNLAIDIYHKEEFFGESSLLYPEASAKAISEWPQYEIAEAFSNCRIMQWPASVIQEISLRRPELAISLLQIQVMRSAAMTERIESFASDNLPRRLARTLIRLGKRLGSGLGGGDVIAPAFTHDLLSEFIGTSRELVTHNMNLFRSLGLIDYSRRHTVIRPEEINRWLSGPHAL